MGQRPAGDSFGVFLPSANGERMRTSWRRKPPMGNTLTSWKEAYRITVDEKGYDVNCLYEDVSSGQGVTAEEAKADFLDNIRLRIHELTEMLTFCALNDPKQVK